ncbi:maleylacetate reductase [Streptomyces sp. RLB3-17]|nr:maleylacetate reductase [Streptomyces sp. RLA2-12]QDN63077.1 maleylacetate reductase [Streptomyces sp. S1D4-20]QDN73129.1 maleylacetate reductase [Streptomyces sp. S1D4-14]QDO03838.1 maleylacetate reductase [Streptomyces sp. RLB1-9]QDO25569.1 maleylacetate reductase [Streptomyces sp. S1A1-8]QDO35686.1 maleylacetate reductase [Streptomyces sp. S1A1-3]QDO45705.1 maleylacetate reductase [Streptomyces sp. RLB3-17]QDO55727.1 maleylacetate reductase [Streptomyces sp. RLB3-5]QDO57004.1 maleylac
MHRFVREGLPTRVVFEPGGRQHVARELERLGHTRAMVLSTPRQHAQATELADSLGKLAVGVFPDARMHTPVEVTERAVAMARDLSADCVIAIGGGSTTGLGKAIALRTDLDQIVLPTTYAGSEVTPILGETVDATKTTLRSLKVVPETVIYDIDLTLSLPTAVTVNSALNSLAHAVEALWAQDPDPVTLLMAREAITTFVACLPRIVTDPGDRDARAAALYGAWLAGTCLATVGMALHHKLCHVLGGTFDLPHAETHAVVLPYVVAYNAPAALEAATVVERVLGAPGATALRTFVDHLGAPTSLRELGMPESGITEAADRCLAAPYYNPRPVEREPLRDLIRDAWAGNPPRADGYGTAAASNTTS